MPRHISRWRESIPDYRDWLSNVNVMRTFARDRPQYQRQHIIDYFGLDGTSKLTLGINNAGMGRVQVNGVIPTGNNLQGEFFKNVPLELFAVPEVGYQFVKWQELLDSLQNPVTVLLDQDSLTIDAIFAPKTINAMPMFITADTILTKNKSPYYALGHTTVDSNATLTIEAGVEIHMPEDASIIVTGKLVIAGTEDDPVIITPNANADHWGALCFVNAGDSSSITYLNINGATKGIDFSRDKAAISGYKSDFSLHNVTVTDVEAPVFVQYGNVSIIACNLHSNVAGDLINIKYAETAVVENCELRGNDAFDSDAIDYDQISNGIIIGNRVYNFYGFNSDAIDLGEGSKDILIQDNIIYNISDKGVSIGHGSTAEIKRNVIANCGQGVGIKDQDSYGYIEHSTFYGNGYGVTTFEKNIGVGGGSARVVNCIIANSRTAAILVDALSSMEVSYCLSNTGELPGLHNLQAEPVFLNNLRLAAGSPAIDYGDPSLPADPDGSLPDLGALAFDELAQNNLIITEIHYNPAEGENAEFIEIKNNGVESFNLAGSTMSGDIDLVFGAVSIAPGEFVVIAKTKSLYEGQGFTVLQWQDGLLPDGPGSIFFHDDDGDVIDFVHYDSRSWWPEEPDGTGPSLELHSTALENMVSSSWRSSYAAGGTPGKSSNSVIIDGIFINEFVAGNNAGYGDENGEFDDWIEFYNSCGIAINLGGLYITDDLDSAGKYQIPITATAATTIQPNGYLLFWADGQAEQGILHLNFRLSTDGEQIGLAQIADNDTVFIDSLTYAEQQTDLSFGRSPDGSDSWVHFDTPTPLAGNVVSSVAQRTPHIPEIFALAQNYPNPFNQSTIINYQLPKASDVELTVFSVTGQKVATLVSGRFSAGEHRYEWHAGGIASGVYLYRLSAGDFVQVKKLVLIK